MDEHKVKGTEDVFDVAHPVLKSIPRQNFKLAIIVVLSESNHGMNKIMRAT